MRRLAITAAAGALALGTLAGSAVAVPPHRHCLETPQGFVEVAQGVVEEAPHETAFHNFHFHVHRGTPPTNIMSIPLDRSCESLNQ